MEKCVLFVKATARRERQVSRSGICTFKREKPNDFVWLWPGHCTEKGLAYGVHTCSIKETIFPYFSPVPSPIKTFGFCFFSQVSLFQNPHPGSRMLTSTSLQRQPILQLLLQQCCSPNNSIDLWCLPGFVWLPAQGFGSGALANYSQLIVWLN